MNVVDVFLGQTLPFARTLAVYLAGIGVFYAAYQAAVHRYTPRRFLLFLAFTASVLLAYQSVLIPAIRGPSDALTETLGQAAIQLPGDHTYEGFLAHYEADWAQNSFITRWAAYYTNGGLAGAPLFGDADPEIFLSQWLSIDLMIHSFIQILRTEMLNLMEILGPLFLATLALGPQYQIAGQWFRFYVLMAAWQPISQLTLFLSMNSQLDYLAGDGDSLTLIVRIIAHLSLQVLSLVITGLILRGGEGSLSGAIAGMAAASGPVFSSIRSLSSRLTGRLI